MFELKNVISVGDYESKAISANFGNLILNTEGMKVIKLNGLTVKSFAELPNPKLKGCHAIYIAFKDGKKSIVDVNKKIFKAMNENCKRDDNMKMDEYLLKMYGGEIVTEKRSLFIKKKK